VNELTVDTVRESLRPIQDPEIFISIVDLGLIRAIEISPDGSR
jgi:metal-sulfur cluster biosynthetic enzyme